MKTSKKKRIFITLGVLICIPIVTFAVCIRYNISPQDVYTTEYKVKTHARRAAVEPIFYIPILKASFTTPLREKRNGLKKKYRMLLIANLKRVKKM